MAPRGPAPPAGCCCMNTPPTWHTSEARTGMDHLHHLIARLGHTPGSLTTFRLGDGLRHLADQECIGVPLKNTAIVGAVARTHEGQWRTQVLCPRCGQPHMHGAGSSPAPRFGQRHPPCGNAPYHLRIDL